MRHIKIYANDNSATFAVMVSSSTSILTWDAGRRAITDTKTGHVWRLRNYHRGGVVIRPVRTTGAKSI